jgi:SAM-dependent methyltransferase
MKHLPKQIDEAGNRNHFHENHWKRVGLDLLAGKSGGLSGLSLLDYGCGRGETLRLAHLDPECVAISKEHGEAVLLESPRDPVAQFGEKSFDVVTCFHVLEHVDRPMEVLAALGKIARRYVVLAVPNLRVLPRPRFLRREPLPVNEGHLQGWDHAHLRNLAERHCSMELVAWGHDHCRIPILGEGVSRIFGEQALIRLETGLFVRLFPFHCASLIALLKAREIHPTSP